MNRTFVLIRLSLKQLIWQMARTFGGRKKFSSLLVLLAAAMLIGLSGLYSWAMIESVPAELNMLIPLSMLSAAFGLILVFGFYHAQGYYQGTERRRNVRLCRSERGRHLRHFR